MSGSDDFELRVWDTLSGKLETLLVGHRKWVSALRLGSGDSLSLRANVRDFALGNKDRGSPGLRVGELGAC